MSSSSSPQIALRRPNSRLRTLLDRLVDISIPDDLTRFLALKAWLADTDNTILSPTPEVDVFWHSLILDTRLYSEVQAKLGVTLHHDPVSDATQDTKRSEATQALWTLMYGEPGTESDSDSDFESDSESSDDDSLPVNAKKRKQSPEESIIIYANRWGGGGCVKIETYPSDSLVTLRKKIEDKTGIHPNSQQLISLESGKQIPEEGSVKDLGIKTGYTIHVYRRPKDDESFYIFAKGSYGKTHTIRTSLFETLPKLKKKLAEICGIDLVRVVYSGETLGDVGLVADIGIAHHSTVYVYDY